MSVKNVPTHPPFKKMILRAVEAIDDKKGSSLPYIKKYLETNYKIKPTNPLINKTITKLVTGGDIIINPKHKGHYKISKESKIIINNKIKKDPNPFSKLSVKELNSIIEENNLQDDIIPTGKNGPLKKDLLLVLKNNEIEFEEKVSFVIKDGRNTYNFTFEELNTAKELKNMLTEFFHNTDVRFEISK
jgi:hypothetical protein